MILLQLFWSFLQIGLFSFGGGYAAMPLIQAQIVTQHDKTLTYDSALILWQGKQLAEMPWGTGSILWHVGRKVPEPFRQREAGIMVDYAGGQLLFLDHKLPRQDFWTRIRH